MEQSDAPVITANISGEPKTGKTHLLLSFPEPIIVFSFDLGFEPVLAKYRDKEIVVKTYPVPIIMTTKPKPYALPLWNQLLEDFEEAIESAHFKTFGFDTGTAIYEINRIARAEELKTPSLVPWQYAEVYARMTGLVLKPRLVGANMVITHWLRDKYLDDKPTGERELDGWRRTIDYVDISLRTQRVRKGKSDVVVTTIEDNRYDMSLNGMSFENLTYEELVAVVVGV